MKEKVIFTAAVTGSIHTPTMSAYLPITPQQIADDAVRAYEAGAAVVHVHARNPENGMPSSDLGLIKEIITNIKSRCPAVICITTGGGMGMSITERLAPVTQYKPELASCNGGSINWGLFPMLGRYKEWKYDWEKMMLGMSEDFIFPNTFKTLREYCAQFAETQTKPEFEVYDSAHVNNLAFLIQAGYIKTPIYLQFVLGILGGLAATVENLMFLVEHAKRNIPEFEFSVCAAGKAEFPICTQGLLLGGNVRVGLEDNLYLDRGNLAKSSAEQVTKIIRIAKELGVEPATPEEARKILGLKGIDKVNY